MFAFLEILLFITCFIKELRTLTELTLILYRSYYKRYHQVLKKKFNKYLLPKLTIQLKLQK